MEASSALVTDSVVIFKGAKVMDEKLVELFMKWLKAFEAVQAATKEKDVNARRGPLGGRMQIAATPANGLRGSRGEARAASISQRPRRCRQLASRLAYADLVRLTGHDPATEISASSSAKRRNGA